MTESRGLVSVVVSVYNIESRLHHCLESISAQTYSNLEILLIDDGSTDGSGRVCDEFAAKDSRVRVIHQENTGIWAVRNRGVEEAKGEYLVFPDGDDYFHKDYVRLLYEAINQGGQDYPMAICDFQRAESYDEDTVSDSNPSFEIMDQTELLDKLLSFPSCGLTVWGANWNKIYRKSSLPRPFQKEYRRCQDYESNIRVSFRIESAVFVHKVLYYWYSWPGQSTQSCTDLPIRDECRARIFLNHFQTVPVSDSVYRAHLLTNLYMRLIVWKEDAKGTEQFDSVSEKIREYEKKTILHLLTCKELTLHRKFHFIFSLHAPALMRLFKKKILLERA